MLPPPPPPPPPRLRLPFIGKKQQRMNTNKKGSIEKTTLIDKIARRLSSRSTFSSATANSSLEFHSDSEDYDDTYSMVLNSNTTKGTKARTSTTSNKIISSSHIRKQPYVDPPQEKVDTSERLKALRREMAIHKLDYYIVPSVDAHGSEYVAASDRRREFISGFTGSVGDAIISKSAAYLVTDARYCDQAECELDLSLWAIILVAWPGGPKDWTEWLLGGVKGARIGIDVQMLSHEKAVIINAKINSLNSKMVYPLRDLVDLIWKDKPPKCKAPVLKQEPVYRGQDTRQKLEKIRSWIRKQRPSHLSYEDGPPTQAQNHVGTLISFLPSIAWVLNLQGQDIPYSPLFHAYLYVGLEQAVVFLNGSKVDDSVAGYLQDVGVKRRDYNDVWIFLRKREWGEGKILLSPHSSYAIALIITHSCYTIAPSYVEQLMAVKSKVETDGLTLQSFIAMLTALRVVRDPIVNDETLSLFSQLLNFPDDTIASGVVSSLDAEVLLDFILSLLRKGSLSNYAVQDGNRKARRLMFKLVSKTDVIPRSLFITDVEKDPQAIAVGGFGKVFRGKRGGQLIALKMLYHGHHHDSRGSIKQEFYTEALAWRSLSHRSILPLMGIYEEGPQLFFVSSFMMNGALHDWRRRHAPVRIHEIQRLLLEVAEGVQYIHSEGIVHGDLHPGNVLLDSEFHCKITDFGSTRHCEATVTRSTKAIAYHYAAPELFGMCTMCCQFDCDGSHNGQDEQHRTKTMKTDMYAFGCVYYAIFFDTIPFHGKNDLNILRLFTKGVRPDRLEDPIMEDFMWDLIQKCWRSNPSERPTMKKIVKVLTRRSNNVD